MPDTPAPAKTMPETMTIAGRPVFAIDLCAALIAEICDRGNHAFLPGTILLKLTALTDAYESALAEAQKDTVRLDWLQEQGLFCSPPPMRAVRGYEWAVRAVGPLGEMPQKDVRAAIDAARAAGEPNG